MRDFSEYDFIALNEAFADFGQSAQEAANLLSEFSREWGKSHILITNPSDRESVEPLGFDIKESQFLDPGAAYLFPRERYGVGFGVNLYDALTLKNNIDRFVGMYYGYDSSPKAMDITRQVGESLSDWGKRINLDNPTIRWEYQKTILMLPITFIKELYQKVLHE